MRARRKTEDKERATERVGAEWADHIAWIAQLKSGVYEYKGQATSLKRCNIIANSRCSLLLKNLDFKGSNRQCWICRREIIQWLANVSNDGNTSIDDFNQYAAPAWKAAKDIFRTKLNFSAQRLQTFLQHEVSTLSRPVVIAPRNAILYLQNDVACFQTTAQLGLKQSAGRGGWDTFHGNSGNSEGGCPPGQWIWTPGRKIL